jgi:hypothetical protein
MEDIEHYERGHTEIAKFRAIFGALLLQILEQSSSYQELRNLKACSDLTYVDNILETRKPYLNFRIVY